MDCFAYVVATVQVASTVSACSLTCTMGGLACDCMQLEHSPPALPPECELAKAAAPVAAGSALII